MITSILKAIDLLLHPTDELINILTVTAKMSLFSSLIALFLGSLIGIWLGVSDFKGRNLLVIINRTLTGTPPVVCGLIIYILFSGTGPFRKLGLMFSVPLMIIAQVLLITPIVVGTMESYLSSVISPLKDSCIGLGMKKPKILLMAANESLYQIFTLYLTAFSRSIAEVGAVSMVGGAIAWKTNVMTTSIMMYTNRGDFTLGVALGIILLVISAFVNTAVTLLQRKIA